MRQWLIIFGLALLLGCVSQGEFNKSLGEKNDLQAKYDTLQEAHSQLQGRYEQLDTRYYALNFSCNYLNLNYEELSLLHNKLRINYEKLNSSYPRLALGYTELNNSYNSLNALYKNLSIRYNRLQDDYRELQSAGSTYRLPKDIPGSPPIANLDMLLTPGSLMLKYLGLNLSSVTDTKSMHPTITAANTAIFTTHFDAKRLRVGDIIVYNSASFELPIMHRIIEIQGTPNNICYTVQGDNNPVPDPDCVRPSQIIGLVAGVIFNANSDGYRYCNQDAIAIVKNEQFLCMPDFIPAGVYVNSQTITSADLVGFPLCSEQEPARPYTVVSPDNRVYCYESVP